jgi:pimeloyl-ACP methyl ester carboxylesterase
MPTARLNGADIYYEEHGEGFPLVFCHEFAGDCRSWDPQVDYFARRYRVITWNYRGYPPSAVPGDLSAYSNDQLIADLKSLLDHLGVRQAHVAGLSMGGNLAMNFAFTHPGYCRSAVIASAGTGTTGRQRFEEDVQRLVAALRRDGWPVVAQEYAMRASRMQLLRKNPQGWERFKLQLSQHSAEGSAFTQLGVQLARKTVFELQERIHTIACPALIVVGDEDEACIEPGLFMKREIPSAGLVMLPQAGHMVNLEEPAVFNAALAEFFAQVEHGKWHTRG